MRSILAILSVLVLSGLGCTTTTSSTDPLCTDEVPDGGNGAATANLACDLDWTCNSETAHYELQCVLMDNGNFECACLTEGVVGTTITVEPFSCTNADAAPAATTGCGWTLM